MDAGQTLAALTLTVTNVNDGADEILGLDGSDVALTDGNSLTTATNSLSVSVAVTGTTATVSFSGTGLSESALQTLVDGITYANTSDSPNTSNRVATITSLTDSGSNEGDNDNVAALSLSSTVTVKNVNDDPTGSVTISGIATEDEELTAGNTLADADGLGTVSYQWKRGGSAIDGATDGTYSLGDDDVGQAITVTAGYTDNQGTAESVTSSATAAVENVNDDPTGSLSITGTAAEDQTLTADTSAIGDDDGLGTFSYQWEISEDGSTNWSAIAGGTGETFQPGDNQVEKYVRVTVGYTDGHGTAESLASSATGQIANLNDAPSDIILSSTNVGEGEPAGTVVGTLYTTDADAGDSHTYALAAGTGDTDNGSFTIDGDSLKSAAVFDMNVKSSYSIRVRTTDSGDGSLTRDETFAISVTSVGVTGFGTVSYTEQGAPVAAAGGISITASSSYADGYLRFSLSDTTGTETLALTSSATPAADGHISVSGSSVYVGTGSGTRKIGEIDVANSGENGSDFQVNFATPMDNTGFESGDASGWSINSSYGGLPGDDHSSITQSAVVTTEDKSSGSYSLKLSISGRGSVGYGTAHGPEVVSSYFEATAGDTIAVDWRAVRTSDDYDVYGYLVDDEHGGQQIQLFYSRGTSRPWSTTEIEVPQGFTSSQLKFRFLNGTYDRSGGYVVGSLLYIDNIRVYSSSVDDGIVSQIARQVTYEDSSDDPNPAKTITVEIKSYDGTTGGESTTIETTPVNDAPIVTVPGPQDVEEDSTTITGITVSDIDYTRTPGAELSMTLEADHGTLTLSQTVGLSGVSGDGTATVMFQGTHTDINTALDGLEYQGDQHYNGDDTLTVTVNDQGFTGGGALQDQDTVLITVSPVNDAPVITVPGAQETDEDIELALTGISISDVDLAETQGGNWRSPWEWTTAPSPWPGPRGSST